MKTILHIITGLGGGGAERQLTALVRGLDAAEFRSVVVSLSGIGAYGPQVSARADFHDLGLSHPWQVPAALFRLAGLIRRVRPDLVQTWLYHADLAGLLASWLVGAPPVVWGLRCSDMDHGRYGRLTRLLAVLSRWPVVIAANSVAGLEAHRALGYRPRRSQIIANGIDVAAFRPDPLARRRLRQEWGVAEGELLVGCCARYDPMKDHASLFKAFAGLEGTAKLVLAGTGCGPDDKALATEMAAAGLDPACVLRLGWRADIPEVMAALDVAVLSSAFGEGHPNAVAEAMAVGLPVVATDVGDCRLIVDNAGEVVPPRSPDALRQALARMLAHSADRRAEIGLRGRQRIKREYSLDAMIRAYAELYRRLASE